MGGGSEMLREFFKNISWGYGIGIAMLVSGSLAFGAGIILITYFIRNGIPGENTPKVDVMGEVKAGVLGSVVMVVVVVLLAAIIGVFVFGMGSSVSTNDLYVPPPLSGLGGPQAPPTDPPQTKYDLLSYDDVVFIDWVIATSDGLADDRNNAINTTNIGSLVTGRHLYYRLKQDSGEVLTQIKPTTKELTTLKEYFEQFLQQHQMIGKYGASYLDYGEAEDYEKLVYHIDEGYKYHDLIYSELYNLTT